MRVYYSPDYTATDYMFDTTRKAQWIAESIEQSPIEGLELVVPASLTQAQVETVHEPGYVHSVKTGHPLALAESQGFDWDEGIWPMALASNGGVVAAAMTALETGVSGSLSSGLHHAGCGSGSGFCTFNGLVLAARAVLDAGAGPVLILDLDAHCGGGTASLIESIPDLWQVDVAVREFDSYTSSPRVSLDIVSQSTEYLTIVQRRLSEIKSRGLRFGICLYYAGMDPYEGCPTGGTPGITHEMLATREKIVFEWCKDSQLPVAFALGGGYIGPQLGTQSLVNLHRLTLTSAVNIAQ